MGCRENASAFDYPRESDADGTSRFGEFFDDLLDDLGHGFRGGGCWGGDTQAIGRQHTFV